MNCVDADREASKALIGLRARGLEQLLGSELTGSILFFQHTGLYSFFGGCPDLARRQNEPVCYRFEVSACGSQAGSSDCVAPETKTRGIVRIGKIQRNDAFA